MKRRIFGCFLFAAMLFGYTLALLSCGSSGEGKAMDEIVDIMYYLDGFGMIDMGSKANETPEDWQEMLNEEFERHGKDILEEEIKNVYYTRDDTYVIQFGSTSDAKRSAEILTEWENECPYDDYQIKQEDSIVFFGERTTISLIMSYRDKENNKLDTASAYEIENRMLYLDRKGIIDLEKNQEDEAENWLYEINDELERNNESELEGQFFSVFYTDAETYVIEFENSSDAQKAISPLSYWENEHRYNDWCIINIGKIIMFGERSEISLILNNYD